MREICQSGSEGGGEFRLSPYPYQECAGFLVGLVPDMCSPVAPRPDIWLWSNRTSGTACISDLTLILVLS
jgi:hypothetical protein